MCGLITIHSAGQPITAGVIDAGVRALAHRGPDGAGAWTSPRGDVALGHARLSIIDLDGGSQPLFNEDGELAAVVTGEFYGYREIRRELEGKGHRFATRSDSEILLHLYEDAGFECLDSLRGEFAFVLWDGRRRLLFAGRDRFGVKPLFYARVGSWVVYASEVKALLACGVGAAWDEESVYRQLLTCAAEDRTLFAGVSQIPAGNYLVGKGGTLTLRRYWDPDYPTEPGSFDPSDPVHGLSDAIVEAVSERLVADVRVGFMLSGGLDSSVVLSVATRALSTAAIPAFTVSFDHPIYDESPAARSVSASAGAQLHETRVDYSDIASHFEDAVWHGEGLFFNGHAVARYILAREIRRAGIKTVLAGEGADELFAGYFFSMGEMTQVSPVRLPGDASHALQNITRRVGRVPALLSGLAANRAPMRELLSRDFLERFRGSDPLEMLLDGIDLPRLARYHPVLQSLYLWTRSFLPGYVLAAERLDMAHGLEVRQPFLDHRLFELVRRVPGEVLVQGPVDKPLLRSIAAHWVPEGILKTPKHPFTAPPVALTLSNPLMTWIQDMLRSRSLSSVPVLDRRRILTLLDALPGMSASARIALDPVLMIACSLCVLHERFLARRTPQ